MSRNLCLYAAALGLLTLGVSRAQSHDAWLMQNYRFTGPPAPGSVKPTDPIISELWRIEDNMHWILWRAKQDEDYWTALAAAAQMGSNVLAINGVMEQRDAVAAAKADAPPAPIYLIAFNDHTIVAAIQYWTDGAMLHYVTRDGVHTQRRLDEVDRGLSDRLNRERNLKFQLPQ
jgi:hypothetical protein